MASRGSEAWWFEHWGQPCKGPRSKVVLGGHTFTVDTRAVPAFEAWERVRARHGYVLHPPYPAGDSGTGNCRHIGNDPDRPWSTHAWWAALDGNWNTNPQRKPLTTDLQPQMIEDLEALRTAKTGAKVFRWGGRFSTPDAMHWEVYATPAELAEGIADPYEEDVMNAAQEAKLDDALERIKAVEDHLGHVYGPIGKALYKSVTVDGAKVNKEHLHEIDKVLAGLSEQLDEVKAAIATLQTGGFDVDTIAARLADIVANEFADRLNQTD